MGIQEKIREIEEEMKRTQKNKATEYHLGMLKSKLAQLRRQLIAPSRKGGGGGFDVRKSGDATVAIIGLPSVGKSTLLIRLTRAESRVASYAFTTLKCIPGILEYNGAKIQVLDLPGIIEGAKEGKGRGREVIAVARGADLILIMLDAAHPRQYFTIVSELEGFGIRLNQSPPDISISKHSRGGIAVEHTVKLTRTSPREVTAALNEYGYYSADVIFRTDATIDQLIDVLEGNRVYLPVIVTVNKIDLVGHRVIRMPVPYLPISAEKNIGIETLKTKIFESLRLIKIFTKRKGEVADMEEPLIVRENSSVAEICDRLHRDLKKEFKYALVWGASVKHPGQRVGLQHRLRDGDVIQIIKK